ncbi:hypothetical protein OQA88_8415 [Cercophora sp. LCS_1]
MALLLAILLSILPLTSASPNLAPEPQCGRGIPPNPLTHQPQCISINAGTSPESWYPWTHRPYCVEAWTAPWCVFTNAAVPRPPHGDQRGISVITTPERAAAAFNLAELPLEKAFSYIPSAKKIDRPPFRVEDIPGKGKGVVATKKIEKDKVIMIDHVAVLSTAEYSADVTQEEVRELLFEAVERLSAPERVRGLSGRGRDRRGFLLSKEEDVLSTNSFELPVAGWGYMGLFPELSRVNHACRPNAHVHFSEASLAITVWSARDIEPGEEITISYSAVDLTYAERQKTLADIWGFNCTCSLCTADKKVRDESDARRLKYRNVKDELVKLSQDGKFEQAAKLTKDFFQAADEEELTALLGDLYEFPARIFYQLGDLEEAKRLMKRSRQEAEVWGVPGHDDQLRLENNDRVMARLESEIAEEKKRKKRKPQVYLGKKT